jgi:WD40 repeat protein
MNAVKNPYVGPRTFQKEESHLYFGRDREARDLAALVSSERLVLFYAQSGAGKSSLLNTCLIPDLEKSRYEVFPVARVSSGGVSGEEAGNIYIYNLMRSLVQHEIEPRSLVNLSLSRFLKKLDVDENGYFYDEGAAEITESEGYAPWRRALIIDQFEEVFSTNLDAWEKREDFFRQLAQAMQDDPYLWVVLVMREDYIAALDPYAHILPGGLRTRYYMQRLSREAALKAMKNPVEKLRPYADGVAEKLVENLASIKVQKPGGKVDVQPGQYVEPVQLQVVCYGLWENLSSDGTQITEKDLQEVGDVNQSLERYYDGRVNAVAKEKNVPERLIREWFGKELITSGGVRNMVLRDATKTDGLADEVIQSLQGDLVRAEMRAGQIWYELSHDRLIEPVLNSNAKWFEQNLNLFQRQVMLWIQQARSDSLLLRDKELRAAEAEAKTLQLTHDEKTFLDACRTLRRRTQRDRIIFTMIAVGFVVQLIAVYFLWDFNQQIRKSEMQAQLSKKDTQVALGLAQQREGQAVAARQEAEAQTIIALAGSLAAQADSIKSSDHALSLLLAMEAYQREPNLLTRTTLFQLLQFSPYTRMFGFGGSLSSIAVSPDGKWIAVSSLDQISIIDSENQIVSSMTTGLGLVNSLSFNKDGTLLAAGGCVPDGCAEAQGQVTLWDMSDPKQPKLLSDIRDGHTQRVKAIAFSPDGSYLASGSYDGTIVLWDVLQPDALQAIGIPLQDQNYSGFVTSLAFNPEGKTLISAGDDGSIHIWNVSTPETAALIGLAPTQHTGAIYSIAFAPLGINKFASASDDNTVVLWDWDSNAASITNPLVLEGHDGFVRSVAFNSTGTILASAGFDNSIILWNVETAERIGPALSVHTEAINTVAFGTAEMQNILLSGSSDHTLILWDLSTRQPVSKLVKEMPLPSGIGQTAKSGEVEATVERQQILLKGREEALNGHMGAVNTLNFDPQKVEDRLLLSSASDDQTVIVWDVTDVLTADIFLKLEGFGGPVTSAFFSSDGKQLTTIESNGQTTVWTIDPGDWLQLACRAAGRNLNPSEWMQYLPGQEFHKTCEVNP